MEDRIMKRLFYLGMAAIFALAACTRHEEFDFSKADLTLVAKTESPEETKTIVEDETHVYWEPGDAIRVFSGNKSGQFVTDIAASAATATFKGTLGKDAWTEGMDLWAVYPYSETAALDGASITTVFPSEQEARAGSFGKGVNLSVAHATTSELQFYNVGGGLRFSLSEEGIQCVVLTGMDGEVLAGKVKVGFQGGKPAILDVTEGKTSITLTPPEGATFATNTWYYIVAIPGALEKGFTLQFQKADQVGSRVFDKPVTIKRGIFGQLTHADTGADYSTVSDNNIAFKDELVKSIVVQYFDTNEDGELSYREAAVVLSFLVDKAKTRSTEEKVSIFAGTGITSFDELVFFTGLTRIEDGTFAGCTELNSIIIPENIAEIGDNAFNGCTSLQSITATADTPPTIGVDAFANTGNCPISVPEDVVDEYVTAWNEYAPRILGTQPLNEIWYVSSDRQVVTPHDPTVFGANLLTNEYADGKGVMTFDGPVTKLGYSAFYECSTMTEISLPGMVGLMEDNAIAFCGLEHLSLPERLDRIEAWAINDCPGLTEITIPENVTFIGYGNFAYCPNITSITVDSGNPTYDSRNGCNAIIHTDSNVLVIGCQNTVIPEGMTEIDTFAFGGCENLRQIVIPEGVIRLHWRAFCDCIGLEGVSLPTSLENMGVGIFQGCTSLKEITIPENVRIMGYYEFDGCKNLESVTVLPPTPPSVFGSDSDFGGHYENLPANPTQLTNSRMFQNTGECPILVPGGSVDKYLSDGIWAFYSSRIRTIPGTEPTPEAVDLGLPSGVKWASFNLGAVSPEGFGFFSAWGVTEPKERYNRDTYSWNDGTWLDMTKYCYDSRYGHNGFEDGKRCLDPEDDAAHALLGGSWRMPSAAEMDELVQSCFWSYVSVNGVYGYKATGPNGNSVFFPFAGWMNDNVHVDIGAAGYYWTNFLDLNKAYSGFYLSLVYGKVMMTTDYRYLGYPIRPVYTDLPTIPVESISLDKTQLEMTVGESVRLKAYLTPSNATFEGIRWFSTSPSSLTVNNSGTVTALEAGTGIIEVYALDGAQKATCTVTVKEKTFPVPDVVDLGLSIPWGSFNVGASAPEEYGDYFAWGETEPYYASLDPLTWKAGMNSYSWVSYRWGYNSRQTLEKYCPYPEFGRNGYSDDKFILDLEDDAAASNLGGLWRMPTLTELRELRDQCTWTRSSKNGVNGYEVTSNTNGNSIFIPASGAFTSNSLPTSGTNAFFWTSSIWGEEPFRGVSFYGHLDDLLYGVYDRYFGLSVRPVYGAPADIIHVESISVDQASLELAVGQSASLTATVLPENATEPGILWSSSDNSVATVANGTTYVGANFNTTTIKANAAGTTTITATSADGKKIAICQITVNPPVPEFVDLGLPVKWATFNLGASKPEEFGNYYAWGDEVQKVNFATNTYKHMAATVGIDNMTKYQAADGNTNAIWYENGVFVGDGKTTLEPVDDPASILWGGAWRSPTAEEWAALQNTDLFTWTWTDNYNGLGVSGSIVTSKITGYVGNKIFIPAAGYKNGNSAAQQGQYGLYWTASLNTADSAKALTATTGPSDSDISIADFVFRTVGQSIRPVYAE